MLEASGVRHSWSAGPSLEDVVATLRPSSSAKLQKLNAAESNGSVPVCRAQGNCPRAA